MKRLVSLLFDFGWLRFHLNYAIVTSFWMICLFFFVSIDRITYIIHLYTHMFQSSWCEAVKTL